MSTPRLPRLPRQLTRHVGPALRCTTWPATSAPRSAAQP